MLAPPLKLLGGAWPPLAPPLPTPMPTVIVGWVTIYLNSYIINKMIIFQLMLR